MNVADALLAIRAGGILESGDGEMQLFYGTVTELHEVISDDGVSLENPTTTEGIVLKTKDGITIIVEDDLPVLDSWVLV